MIDVGALALRAAKEAPSSVVVEYCQVQEASEQHGAAPCERVERDSQERGRF